MPDNVPLDVWIRSLMADRRLYAFYQTPEWRALRAEVMADHNNECEACAAEGVYTRADTVHHEHEVKDEPSMALTRWVTEADGTRREVLHPLCNHHHNVAHGRSYDQLRCQKQAGKERESKTREEIW